MAKLRITEGIAPDHLAEVYSDAYIARVGHDQRPFAPVIHPVATYVSAWVDDAFAGAFLAVRATSVETDVHALLFRRTVKHSRELGRMFISWCFERPIFRITAQIIEGLDSALNYCLRLGFKREGFKPAVCTQGGALRGVHILGITRADWSLT